MLIYMTLYINMYMSECVCVCVYVLVHITPKACGCLYSCQCAIACVDIQF